MVIIMVSLVGIGFLNHGAFVSRDNFDIHGVHVISTNNISEINELSVNITDLNPSGSSTKVFFRIVPTGYMNNSNGFLWVSNNQTIFYGKEQNIIIHPRTEYDLVPANHSYRIMAYYNASFGSKTVYLKG